MKKTFAAFLIAISAYFAFAAEPELYHLNNNIPVYVKNDSKSDLTAVYAVVKGGVQYLTPETSGLENAVFTLMEMGSKKYSYEQIKSFCYETQGGLTSYCINDGSVFGMTCINKYFDQTFDLFQDSFFNPLFNSREYDLLMQDYEQSVTATMNDPASMLMYYAQQMIYAGHPYGAKPSVTQDSLDNITLAAVKQHYKTLLDSRRISIVASGKVDAEKLVSRLNELFGKMSALSTPLVDSEIPEVVISGEPVVLVHPTASGSGIIMRTFASPRVRDPEYPVARVASSIYSDVLFNIVREKYGICYTPSSDISSSHAPYGVEVLYRVSNLEGFKTAMDEARQLMLQGTLLGGKDKDGSHITESLESRLAGYKNSYINKKYATQATVGGVASRMAASLLQFGDIDSADHLTDYVKSCTAEDVIRVFKKYWVDESSMWYAVVGPEDEEKCEIALKEASR